MREQRYRPPDPCERAQREIAMRSRIPPQHSAGEWLRQLPQLVAARPRLAQIGRSLRVAAIDLPGRAGHLGQFVRVAWASPRVRQWRALIAPWLQDPVAGSGV